MLQDRQKHILKLVVEAYVDSAEPVGSKWLSQTFDLGLSPATVRKDMAALERQGYISQPHTSAGRIPTEKGYQYYLKHFVKRKPDLQAAKQMRKTLLGVPDEEQALRALAKALVVFSGEAVILAFGPHHCYYTGVSNLFFKPDFAEIALMQTLSELIDQFDEVLVDVFENISQEPQVYIGQRNPFGAPMSAILMKCEPHENTGVVGLIGPIRMNYQKNINLMESLKDALYG